MRLNIIFVQQGIPGVGENILCNLSGQCASIRTPYDGSPLCTDFTGDLAFLNDQLKTMTFSSMTCSAFE